MDPPPLIYHLDHNSVMVINSTGRMRQLFVPFKAKVLEPTICIKEGSWVYIEEVQPHSKHRLLYRVGNNWWPYYIFRLEIHF